MKTDPEGPSRAASFVRVLFLSVLLLLVAPVLRDAKVSVMASGMDPVLVMAPKDPFLGLSRDADAVVIASLTSRRSYWSPQHNMIYTEYSLTANACLYGTCPPTLTVIEEGGEVGEVGLAVSDAVKFEPGRHYALLLQRGPTGFRVIHDIHGMRTIESPDPAQDPLLRDLKVILETSHPNGSAR